uniref:Uncharacterized protein n=1 Tax=Anguilla anguilla TaxID=7936 RepID=A0A0E9TPA0_ANGAN
MLCQYLITRYPARNVL